MDFGERVTQKNVTQQIGSVTLGWNTDTFSFSQTRHKAVYCVPTEIAFSTRELTPCNLGSLTEVTGLSA
jgi:hypothetical protein